MKVTIKFFGLAATRFGRKAKVVELPAGTTIAGLLTVIQEREGDVDYAFIKIMNFLVNGSRADRSTELHDQDEIMVMSSLGGG